VISADFALRAVHVAFNGTTAIGDANLRIGPGEAVGLVGPSGSGKTTLLRLLNGTLRPTAGTVSLDGEEITSLTNRQLRGVRARIGFVHQDLSLVPNLRVLQNVLLGRIGQMGLIRSCAALVAPCRAAVRRVHEILERVGIPEKLYERTDRLSGGQRQRVAIARALVTEPPVILADEPTGNLDSKTSEEILALFEGLHGAGTTVVMVTHEPDVGRHAQRILRVRDGRLSADEAVEGGPR